MLDIGIVDDDDNNHNGNAYYIISSPLNSLFLPSFLHPSILPPYLLRPSMSQTHNVHAMYQPIIHTIHVLFTFPPPIPPSPSIRSRAGWAAHHLPPKLVPKIIKMIIFQPSLSQFSSFSFLLSADVDGFL